MRGSVEQARPGELDLTVSAGVAADSGGDIRYEQLFRAADAALLEAKRAAGTAWRRPAAVAERLRHETPVQRRSERVEP